MPLPGTLPLLSRPECKQSFDSTLPANHHRIHQTYSLHPLLTTDSDLDVSIIQLARLSILPQHESQAGPHTRQSRRSNTRRAIFFAFLVSARIPYNRTRSTLCPTFSFPDLASFPTPTGSRLALYPATFYRRAAPLIRRSSLPPPHRPNCSPAYYLTPPHRDHLITRQAALCFNPPGQAISASRSKPSSHRCFPLIPYQRSVPANTPTGSRRVFGVWALLFFWSVF